MKWVKRISVFLLLLVTAVLIHYYLPQRDIVKVVDTDVKRMDISKGSPFWDRPDAGTNAEATRDVRFIFTVTDKGRTIVYRNEDTGWSFPFYLKFDSSDLSARAQDMARQDDTWVAVTHYGWRIRLFSIFPNATKIKPVAGPGTFLIPWFNIVFLTIVAFILFSIFRFMRKWKKRHVDPVVDDIENTARTIGDKAEAEINETRTAASGFLRKWFGTSKPRKR